MIDGIIACPCCQKPIDVPPLGQKEELPGTVYIEFYDHRCAFCDALFSFALDFVTGKKTVVPVHNPHPGLRWWGSLT